VQKRPELFVSILPLLIMSNIILSGSFCVFASTKLMKLPFSPGLAFVCMAIIGGIYALNRAGDFLEDYCNNSSRLVFFLNRNHFLFIGVMLVVFSLLYLTFTERLSLFHMILILSGISYSFPSLPVIRNDRLMFVKMKQIPVIKNLVVAVLWGTAIFLIPPNFFGLKFQFNSYVMAAIFTMIVASFTNTLFNDIRDLTGDRIAGNRTLPVIFGERKTVVVLITVNTAWFIILSISGIFGIISMRHMVLLMVMVVYPLSYVMLFTKKIVSNRNAEFISDLQLLVFAVVLLGMYMYT